MISLLCLCPTAHDATSYYRGAGPWGRLKQATGTIELISPEPVDWPIMNQVDVCFMQRPFTAGHAEIVKLARRWKVPLWLDYDDDLFCVTSDNPSQKYYAGKDTQERLKWMLGQANVVTVTTLALKEKLSKYAENVVVVPNALDDKRLTRKLLGQQNRTVLWRGSDTHARDLIDYTRAIHAAHEKSDHKWCFLGYNPFYLTDYMPEARVIAQPGVPPEDYFPLIQDAVRPEIMIVPLADTEFNRSKSNIAWIEGTLAGAACLVPHWDQWMRPGAVTYTGPEEFQSKLEKLLLGEINARACNEESWGFIRDNLLLSQVNKTRLEILENLAGHS